MSVTDIASVCFFRVRCSFLSYFWILSALIALSVVATVDKSYHTMTVVTFGLVLIIYCDC